LLLAIQLQRTLTTNQKRMALHCHRCSETAIGLRSIDPAMSFLDDETRATTP
jgi:formylmethanofuran dehydrogenase subunit E